MYGLYGFFSQKLYGFFFENCTDCTDFSKNVRIFQKSFGHPEIRVVNIILNGKGNFFLRESSH